MKLNGYCLLYNPTNLQPFDWLKKKIWEEEKVEGIVQTDE